MTAPTLAANDPCWCGSGRKYKRCHRLADLDPQRVADEQARREQAEREAALYVRPGPAVAAPRGAGRHPAPRLRRRPARPAQGPRQRPPQDARGDRAHARAPAGPPPRCSPRSARAVRPGVTTDELDAVAHAACLARGGYPSPLGYNGFPKSLCTSVNEVICHGIPDSTVLKDGDIVNCDVTIYLDGVHGDTNATFLVGDVDERLPPAGRGDPRVPRPRHRRGAARRHRARHRPGDPGARRGPRLRRGAQLRRPRHRPHLPQRAAGLPLRQPRRPACRWCPG